MKVTPWICILSVLSLLFVATSCSSSKHSDDIVAGIQQIITGKNAHIGVAVILDNGDTVTVNGSDRFPMLSVYKFPIALAFAQNCRNNSLSFDDSCVVTQSDLNRDTYSPMLEKYGSEDSSKISYRELLAYALQLSDNNASDILLREAGGVRAVRDYLQSLGISGIAVATTEEDMQKDNSLCFENYSTPIAMARLLDLFDTGYGDTLSVQIKQLMENCATGQNRLMAPYKDTDAVVGHKTGTGWTTPDGHIMAVNDVGYVHLSDGGRYVIAVFIADSQYTMEETEHIIAEIAGILAPH